MTFFVAGAAKPNQIIQLFVEDSVVCFVMNMDRPFTAAIFADVSASLHHCPAFFLPLRTLQVLSVFVFVVHAGRYAARNRFSKVLCQEVEDDLLDKSGR